MSAENNSMIRADCFERASYTAGASFVLLAYPTLQALDAAPFRVSFALRLTPSRSTLEDTRMSSITLCN